MADLVGQKLKGYLLESYLGRGANGDVYLGTSPNGEKVAVKALQRPVITPHEVQEFIDEARAFRFNDHPHIVRLLDFGIADGGIAFFVLQFALKGSLSRLRGSRLPLSSIIEYTKQIASALQHVHDKGLVHRDIKPGNILQEEHDEILLADFGIADASYTKLYKEQRVIGTPPYMAPEHWDAHAQSASDQYSLAIMVYEWICGELPFTHGDLEYQHKYVPPPPLRAKIPTIPQEVEQVVMKALAKDPKQRFPSVQAFANALEYALLPTRKISLFGYETDGGEKSVLWNNPEKFSSDAHYAAKYEAWSKTKRDFTEEEVLRHNWVKISGNTFIVRFLPDGSLSEGELFDSTMQWGGSWQLVDGMLRINIGDYELDVFANREGKLNTGIEFRKGQSTPWSYYTVYYANAFSSKRWIVDDVPALVHQIYGQILNRRADESGLITYGALLNRGEKSVRDIVRIIGHSPEYARDFIKPFTDVNEIEVAVEICYERFLGRNADDRGREKHIQIAGVQGFNAVIDALVDSDEYKQNFGEDDIPMTAVGLAVASRFPHHLEWFYRGKDGQLKHRWWYGSEWSAERNLGSFMTSAPAAISWGGKRIDCFYRGKRGHLYHRWWDGSWQDEEYLGGILTSAPAVASRFPNHLECFYRGQDNCLWHRWWNGAEWGEEGKLGGTVTSAPAAISWGGERIDCFYRGQGARLYHRWWDGSGWSAEEDLGGCLTSAPAVTSLGPNHLDCFYRNQNHNLCHRWWDGSRWSAEDNMGGQLISALSVVSWDSSRIDCIYQDQDNRLCHRWWDSSHWSDEERL